MHRRLLNSIPGLCPTRLPAPALMTAEAVPALGPSSAASLSHVVSRHFCSVCACLAASCVDDIPQSNQPPDPVGKPQRK